MALKKNRMSFPVFAWSVRFFSLAALLVFASVILMIDPGEAAWTVPLFVVTWFLFWAGVSAWGLLGVYRRSLGEEKTFRYKRSLLRQSLLIALMATSALMLKYIQALEWWTAGLVLTGGLLLELTLRRQSSIA